MLALNLIKQLPRLSSASQSSATLTKRFLNIKPYEPHLFEETKPIIKSEEDTSIQPSGEASAVSVVEEYHATSFIPDEHIHTRRARISRPSKNVMQSGTSYTNRWKIEFESRMRWENLLMGWTSSADPLSNLTLTFPTKEAAMSFCDKNGWFWFVEEQPERKIRRKNYGDNFAWNKRTRLGSK